MSGKDLKEVAKTLPKNWQVFHSKKANKLYYYNIVTKKTQWQHPSLGGKNHNHDEKSRFKKHKATIDEQNRVKYEESQISSKSQSGSNPEAAQMKMKKEKTESGVRRAALKPAKPPGKPLNALPKVGRILAAKPVNSANTQTRIQAHGSLDKTQAQGSLQMRAVTQGQRSAETGTQAAKQTIFANNAVEKQAVSKKISKLQPLTCRKSIGEGSDSGVSDSSERVRAWLADTSHVEFKENPLPHETQELPKTMPAKQGKEKTERQKNAILERAQTSSEVSKEKSSNILDKLLPKHAQALCKKRYAPYKLTKQHKPCNSDQEESRQNSAKGTATSKVRQTARQDGVSTETTNSIAGHFGEETPDGFLRQESRHKASEKTSRTSFGVDSCPASHVDQVGSNLEKASDMQNSLQKMQESSEEYAQQSEVLNDRSEEEVLSMDEGCEILGCENEEVADMEIDNPEELTKEIVHELQEMRHSLVVHPKQLAKDQITMKVSSDGYEDNLYIVLDTNVLLSHLKFVIELKDFPIPGVGRPILVIPWIIIQELDSLKENKWKRHESGEDAGKTMRVDLLARTAIKFLNNSFQKSDPRVRGQTVEEAAEHVGNLQEESNDDRILQCCFLFSERAQNGGCVLFSNDVNLCNKAMVNGLKAFNHEKLLPGLKDLFQCGAMVAQNSEEYNIHLAREEDAARQRQKADDILCELQIILREGLSFIIESEMKTAYDDLWVEVIHIKPPWTLIDVLHLLEKHWIAVFGHVLKRDRKSLIDKLRKKFDDRKGTASSLEFCSEMLQLALELFQSFSAHSNYGDAMPKCLAAVNVLVTKCRQFQASVSSNFSNVQAKCLTYTTSDSNNFSAVEQRDEVVIGGKGPHEEVTNTFNLIWTAVTQFSTQIFTALGYPNTITDSAPQDFPKASKEEAISFLSVLCPRLLDVVRAIQNILRDPWEKASQNDTLFVQLERAITVFLSKVLSQANNASAEKLFEFCQDASMRTSLIQGLSQLDHASGMLQHCASCALPNSVMSQ